MALFIATLFSNLPYMMLCCIPLFAFVLKVLYVRKRIFYIDHLVYVPISSFAYLAIMLIVLITSLNRRSPAFSPVGSSQRSGSPSLDIPLDSPRLSTGLVLHHLQVLRRRFVLGGAHRAGRDLLCHARVANLTEQALASAKALTILSTSGPEPCAFSGRPPPLPPTIGAIS